MKARWSFLLICIFLSGCVTLNDFMTDYLSKYFGEDISVAYRSLGYPQSVRENYDGSKTHIWATSVYGVAYMPSFSHTTAWAGGTNVNINSTSYTPYGYNTGCVIELTTGDDDRIKQWSYNGSVKGCLGYANMLEMYWDGETSSRIMH